METKINNPQVGIFELIDNKLYFMTEDLNTKKAIGGAVDAANLFHRDLCRNVAKTEEITKESKDIINAGGAFWMKFPRGRVWYIVSEDKYYISSCKEILMDKELVISIIERFNLKQKNVQLTLDSDYNFK